MSTISQNSCNKFAAGGREDEVWRTTNLEAHLRHLLNFFYLRQRLVEVINGFLQSVGRPFVPKVSPLEIILVSVRVYLLHAFQLGSLLRSHFNPDLFRNSPRNLVLERQGIAKVSLIAIRPQVFVGWYLDQLSGDADLLAGAEH